MANHHEPLPPLEQESAMDYHQHENTYDGFIRLLKYSVFALVVLVVILYAVIQP